MVSKSDQLIEAALELFAERGFRATGIDAILERAGVAKMTLYKHFATKNDLVLAALRRADQRSRSAMFADIESRGTAPRDRLLALFDFAEDWVTGGSFRGCMFMRATGEFQDEDCPVRVVCRERSAVVTRYLAGIALQAGAADAGALAHQIMLLFHGVLTEAQGDASPEAVGPMVARARAAAATLIDAAIAGA